MNEITCPYCEHEFYDEEYHYNEEGKIYELECPECEKIMMVSHELRHHFNSYKAPCKNDGDHKLKEMRGIPEPYFKYKRRCEYCDEVFIIDEEKHKEEIEKYMKKIERSKKV